MPYLKSIVAGLMLVAGSATTATAQTADAAQDDQQILEDFLQEVRTERGPLLGVWEQTSSNFVPCAGCKLRVMALDNGNNFLFSDSCIRANPTLDPTYTFMTPARNLAVIILGDHRIASGDLEMGRDASGQLRIAIATTTKAPDDFVGLTYRIEETYRRLSGPTGFTLADLSGFDVTNARECPHLPQGQQLAVFADSGLTPTAAQQRPVASTSAAVQPPQVPAPVRPPQAAAPAASGDSGLSLGEVVALGVVGAAAAAIAADTIHDQFFTEAATPDAPSPTGQGRMVSVRIAAVEAIETTFGFGGDEVFLVASNGTRLPGGGDSYVEIDEGQVWSPDWQVSSAGGISFDLREWDSFNASDVIGNFTVDAAHPPGRFQTTLKGDGAEYRLTYDVQ